jgi:hypothetical protein
VKDFTPTHAGVVHDAMQLCLEAAKKRRAKMPSSADAFTLKAEQLRETRDMILDRLPPEFHSHRAAYPDYRPSMVGMTVRISEALPPNTISIESIDRSIDLT